MADQETKRYMELQMEELKAACETVAEKKTTSTKKHDDNDAELAKMYEDAAEYEEELQCFEKELEIINTNELAGIAGALTQSLPDEERNYAEELKSVLIAGWTHRVEVEKTHPAEQLDIIKATEFSDVADKLSQAFPDYTGDFRNEIKEILVKRWETLIAIKKEHIEEEMEEIYIAGLKPSFVKRIYKKYHGIS